MSCKCFNEFQFTIKALSPNLYFELIKWNWGMGEKWYTVEWIEMGHFPASSITQPWLQNVTGGIKQIICIETLRVINVGTALSVEDGKCPCVLIKHDTHAHKKQNINSYSNLHLWVWEMTVGTVFQNFISQWKSVDRCSSGLKLTI